MELDFLQFDNKCSKNIVCMIRLMEQKFTQFDMGHVFFLSFHEGCTNVPDGAGFLPTFYVINPK